MPEFENLLKALNTVIGHDPDSEGCPGATSVKPSWSSYDCLLEKHIYLFVPKENLHGKLKEEIQRFAKDNNLHFIITTQEYCKDDRDCHGHYLDPFKAPLKDEHVFMDKFPDNINGASLHFLSQKHYRAFEEIRKPEN